MSTQVKQNQSNTINPTNKGINKNAEAIRPNKK